MRKVDTAGIITTVAGVTPGAGDSENCTGSPVGGGLATETKLDGPQGVNLDAAGGRSAA